MTKVRWNGDEAINREVGAATGEGDVIAPGAVVNVPEELAERLLTSSSSWTPATDARKGAK